MSNSAITPQMLFSLLDSPIAYHRIYAVVTGSVTAAVMLSQAMYWTPRTEDPDKWFYKTADEWQKETGLSRREQETARRTLKSLSILEEKKQGLPCKIFFRINIEALYHCIVEGAKQDVPKAQNKVGGKRQTGVNKSAKLDATKAQNNLYTEITPEITPEITRERILEPPSFFPSGKNEESEAQNNISSHAQNSDPNIQDPQTPKPLPPVPPENIGKPIKRSLSTEKSDRKLEINTLLADDEFRKFLFDRMKKDIPHYLDKSAAEYELHTEKYLAKAFRMDEDGDERIVIVRSYKKLYERYKAEQARIEEERSRWERDQQEEVDDGPRMSLEERKRLTEELKLKVKLNKLTA